LANNDSYIRVLHAVPNAPAVDVYANNNIIAKKIPYKRFTQYIKVKAGDYNIEIYPAGSTTDLILKTDVNIGENSIYTIAATGLLPDIGLLTVEDTPLVITPEEVCIRAIHLSPDAPAVDVTLPDGTIVFEDLTFEEVSDYLCVEPDIFTLELRVAGTDQVVLTVPNINLRPDRFYSIYVVGEVEGPAPLQFLIPLDGNSYISF